MDTRGKNDMLTSFREVGSTGGGGGISHPWGWGGVGVDFLSQGLYSARRESAIVLIKN